MTDQPIHINDRGSLAAFARANQLRPDWHEPDNSGINARVIGDHLDNAFGPRVMEAEAGFQELVVVLQHQDWDDETDEYVKTDAASVNLASLLGWASEVQDPPAIDHEQLVQFFKRILPAIHEPLLTKVAFEWANKFAEEFGL